jgi:hypothetical protein
MFLLETEPQRTVDFCHFPKVGRGVSKELTWWQTLKVFLLEREREKRAGIFCVESCTQMCPKYWYSSTLGPYVGLAIEY